MMGTGSESLASKDSKLEETLKITYGSTSYLGMMEMRLHTILQKIQCEKAGGGKGEKYSELHSSQKNFYSWKNIFTQTLYKSNRK